MKWKNIDANCTDDNEEIDLAHCCDCSYTGNMGKWIGYKTIEGVSLSGVEMVELKDDDTWNLDEFVSPGTFNGEVICPICGSSNFY